MKRTNLTQEDNSEVEWLRRRMDDFYASYGEYDAFQEPSRSPEEWAYVTKAIADRLETADACRVLEFGAGRTGFAGFLGALRSRVHLTVQDVTPMNRDYLREHADEVKIGRVGELEGPFDVIFSTFVLEHISDPKSTLETLVGLLEPGGALLLFCPRYDVPFYLSHSADHCGPLQRFWMGLTIFSRRCWTLLTGRPAFVIHSDPAILHLGWRMDRDAIHWASLIDLRAFFRDRGRLERLPIRSGSWKDWCVKNLLRINICFTRAAS